MKILNIVETINGGIQSLKTYIIPSQATEQSEVERAEEEFKNHCRKNGAKEDDLESYVEDGFFMYGGNSNCTIEIVWSSIQ